VWCGEVSCAARRQYVWAYEMRSSSLALMSRSGCRISELSSAVKRRKQLGRRVYRGSLQNCARPYSGVRSRKPSILSPWEFWMPI